MHLQPLALSFVTALLNTTKNNDAPFGCAFCESRTKSMFKFLVKVRFKTKYLKGKGKGKAVAVTGLEWPRGFQEVKVPRFRDNGTG
jgi:hypothetical protein